MSSIASIASLSSPRTSSASSAGPSKQTLDFMKLLMAQMRNQNPMDPQTGTEFMGQIAQFTQVEGINKLNQGFNEMILLQGLSQGSNLIGKTVVYDKNGTSARGTVASVQVNDGKVQLTIGGAAVNLSQVRSVESGTRTS